MIDPQLQPILQIDLLNLDQNKLDVLLRKDISTQYLLNVAKNSGQLIDLLKQVLIHNEREKDNCGDSKKQISIWRLKKFGDRLEEAFIDRKKELDSVSFWTLFTKERGTALEIFYQLCNQETTFKKLASLYKGVRTEKRRCYSELSNVLRRQLNGAGIENHNHQFQSTLDF